MGTDDVRPENLVGRVGTREVTANNSISAKAIEERLRFSYETVNPNDRVTLCSAPRFTAVGEEARRMKPDVISAMITATRTRREGRLEA